MPVLLSETPRGPTSNMTGRHSPLIFPGLAEPKTFHGNQPGALGTGKKARTILADQGDFVTVVSDVPYTDRSRHFYVIPKKGTRAMHKTTLTMKCQDHGEYDTTVNTYHGNLPSSQLVQGKRVPYPSQHTSQFDFGTKDDVPNWDTKYVENFPQKPTDAPHRLHYPSQINKLNMNEGSDMKTVFDTPNETQYRYWSQYNRYHNKLGAILGPGVSRERVIRSSYNPLTGSDQGAAWKHQNHRISGNRVLYNGQRKEASKHFTLG